MALEPLTPEQYKIILEEFGATEESVRKDLHRIMNWLEKQPHLPSIKDENYLCNVLLQCKNSIERAKKRLETMMIARAKAPEIFSNYDPCDPGLVLSRKILMYIYSPRLTPDGYRVVIFRAFPREKNAELPTVDNWIKMNIMNTDLLFKCSMARGLIMLFDFQYVDLRFSLMLGSLLKKEITIAQKTVPLRVHKIYLLNLNSKFEQGFNAVRPFLSSKISNRVEIWNKNPTDLAQELPKDALPSDYGGTAKSVDELRDIWCQYLVENREWLRSLEKLQANLSRLPEEIKTNQLASNFGFEGSFRELTLD